MIGVNMCGVKMGAMFQFYDNLFVICSMFEFVC